MPIAPGSYSPEDVEYYTPAMGFGFGAGVYMPQLRGPWRSLAEAVPVRVLKRFIQFDRTQPAEMAGPVERVSTLAEQIKEGLGIHEPLMLQYFPRHRVATLGEGNHRLAAAERLGLSHVPVWVLREEQLAPQVFGVQRPPVPVPGVAPDEFGSVPGSLLPSQIGIEGAERISPLRMRLLRFGD